MMPPQRLTPGRTLILAATLIAALLCPRAANAQSMKTIRYDLQNVYLKPDLSHKYISAKLMKGSFLWTYTPGKFAEGSGRFTSLSIPFWGPRTSPALKIQFETKAIDFSMIGNYHGLGLDLTLRLKPPLDPKNPAKLDTVFSKFTIEVGVAYKGHVISGSIVPHWTPSVTPYGKGCQSSSGTLLHYANGLPTLKNAQYAVSVSSTPALRPTLLLLAAGQQTPPLPLNKSCYLHVAPLRIISILPTQSSRFGIATWPLPIPNHNSLLGIQLDTQALVVTKTLSLLSSNALRSTLGN